MAKNYWVRFGSGNPTSSAGLAPTFIQFFQSTGVSLAPPAISQIATGSGLYTFSYTPTVSIGFVIDGATTGLSDSVRYVVGSLDPVDRMDEYGITLTAIGTSNIALGTTTVALGISNIALGTSNYAFGASITHYLPNHIGATVTAIGNTLLALGTTFTYINAAIGTTGSTFGGVSTNPVDLFGHLKRMQEFLEGNQDFAKATGVWDIYSRGSSTLLTSKTLTNDTVGVTKI